MKLRFIFSLINSAVMWLSAWTPLSLHPPPQSPMLMETSLMPLICWPGQVKNISTQSEPGLQVSWGCQTEAPPVFIAFLKELHIDLFLFFLSLLSSWTTLHPSEQAPSRWPFLLDHSMFLQEFSPYPSPGCSANAFFQWPLIAAFFFSLMLLLMSDLLVVFFVFFFFPLA